MKIFAIFAFHLPDQWDKFPELLPQRVSEMQRPSKGWARLFIPLLALTCGSIVCSTRAILNEFAVAYFFPIYAYLFNLESLFLDLQTCMLVLHWFWQICKTLCTQMVDFSFLHYDTQSLSSILEFLMIYAPDFDINELAGRYYMPVSGRQHFKTCNVFTGAFAGIEDPIPLHRGLAP